MAKRFTDTDKWKKPFFRFLTPKMKCLWDYITSDCDVAGLWHVDIEIASIKIGETISEEEALQAFKKHIVVLDGGDKWFIPSFIEFQYGGQLTRNNNVFKSIDKILQKYDLYKHLTVEIVDFSATSSAYRDRISQKTRESILLKFDLTCQYCQDQHAAKDLVIDHFIPLFRGGDNSDDNLICCCKRCNSSKTDILPDIFLNKPHIFLKPTTYILSLLEAYKKLKGANNPSEGGKDKDKAQEKEMDKDKDIAPPENFAQEAQFDTGSVIVEMAKIFYKKNPKYPKDQLLDFTAVQIIAGYILDEKNIPGNDYPKSREIILTRWGELTDFIRSNSHFVTYSLTQLRKHYQSVVQSFNNGNKNGKTGQGGINRPAITGTATTSGQY